MRFPRSIKIGGHWFGIEFPYRFRERVDRIAYCDLALNKICVTGMDATGHTRPATTILVGFIHEILHALNFQASGKILGDMGSAGEEERIEILSEGILQVLVDNIPAAITEVFRAIDRENS